MQIHIYVQSSDLPLTSESMTVDVHEDMTLNDIKALVESEYQAPSASQYFLRNNQLITDTAKSVAQLGMSDGDLLGLVVRNTRPTTKATSSRPSKIDTEAESLRLNILGDTNLRNRVQGEMAEFVEAAPDRDRFHKLFNERHKVLREEQRKREEELASLEDDPFDPEKQKKIAEMIRLQGVQENLQKAWEEFPEAFGHVTMLYIDVNVNNVPIKAFVDSGAQTTIMSPDAAERCGINHLINYQYGGIARGVGTAKILGRVMQADIQIGQYSLASSFTVMEGKNVDLLLGLDMLKRHQMCIDLKENCLRIQDDKIDFLPENAIPTMMDEILENEPKIEGPDGLKIGTTTGTVEAPSAQPNTAPSEAPGSSKRKAVSDSPSPAEPRSSAQDAFGQPQPITAHSIAQITELGFTRDEAISALQQVGGNVELAIGLLL